MEHHRYAAPGLHSSDLSDPPTAGGRLRSERGAVLSLALCLGALSVAIAAVAWMVIAVGVSLVPLLVLFGAGCTLLVFGSLTSSRQRN